MVHRIGKFYKLFHDCLKTFPKLERFTLGAKIENTVLEVLELTLSASYLPKYKKNEILIKASDKTDLLKHLIRIAYEIKVINLKRYILIEKNVLEIGKMLGGWIKSNR